MVRFSWHDDGYVSSEDKSKVPCLWKECHRPIHPSELYCSKGCKAKAAAYNKKGNLHHEGAKKHQPNWVYMNIATVVDEEARRALMSNPNANIKLEAHKRAWETGFQFMKPKVQGHGIRRGRNGF